MSSTSWKGGILIVSTLPDIWLKPEKASMTTIPYASLGPSGPGKHFSPAKKPSELQREREREDTQKKKNIAPTAHV